jgi:hypothetical protein
LEINLELSGADQERLVVVGDDLAFLMNLPRDRLLSHTEVRLAAGVLRRLLIDGQLSRVWKPIGQASRSQPTVMATDIDSALAQWPAHWLRYAWAGGAVTSVAEHTGFILADIPQAEHERFGSPEAFFRANPLPSVGERRMTIDQWLDSTSVAIQTNELGVVPVSRRSVLMYIANRKGGVHFDPDRNLSVPRSPKKSRREVEHYLLDHGLLRVGHLSGPEYEVASMAQTVACSGWAADLLNLAHQVAPAEFSGDPCELKFWTGTKQADGTDWATTRRITPIGDKGP